MWAHPPVHCQVSVWQPPHPQVLNSQAALKSGAKPIACLLSLSPFPEGEKLEVGSPGRWGRGSTLAQLHPLSHSGGGRGSGSVFLSAATQRQNWLCAPALPRPSPPQIKAQYLKADSQTPGATCSVGGSVNQPLALAPHRPPAESTSIPDNGHLNLPCRGMTSIDQPSGAGGW